MRLYLSLLLLFPSTFSFGCGSAVTHAGKLVSVANRVQNISEVLADFPFDSTQLWIGANESASVQKSHGISDPRIFISNDCYTITFTLLGKSLEIAYRNQTANRPLPLPVEEGSASINTNSDGLIFVDLKFFPRGNQTFSVLDEVSKQSIFNVYAPASRRRDSKNCAACHVDTQLTKGPYGILNLPFENKTIEAIVSPPELPRNGKIDERGICFPVGLRMIEDCMCRHSNDEKCESFSSAPPLNEEACKRLSFVTHLNAKQDLRFCDANSLNPYEEH